MNLLNPTYRERDAYMRGLRHGLFSGMWMSFAIAAILAIVWSLV